MKLFAAVTFVVASAAWAAVPQELPLPAAHSNPAAHDEGSAAVPKPDSAAATTPAAPGEAQPTVVQSAQQQTSEIIHTPEDAARLSGFQVGADLDHWLGTGTFVNPDLYSSLTMALTVSPAYSFHVKGIDLRLSALGRLLYEYTLPDNETGRRIAPWDIRLGLSAPAIYKDKLTGINVSPSVGLTIPTTLESWQAGLITSASAGVALSRKVSMFDFAATASAAHGFYTSVENRIANPNKSTEQNNNPNTWILCRTGEAYCGTLGMNTNWTVITGLSANFHATKELIISLGYTYIHSWKYSLPVDSLSAQTIDSNGNRVPVGAGQADRTFGFFGVGYDVSEHYNISVSASTIQTPRTIGAGGQAGSFRFPFWAIGNAADNATSVNFTLSAQY